MTAADFFPPWDASKWTDWRGNPIIQPVSGTEPRHVVGDPQVIVPGEFDERWHMFLIGEGKFYRFDSDNGLDWEHAYTRHWHCGPMCVTADGETWIAYYTHSVDGETRISARTTADLTDWSDPTDIILPETEWEREGKRVQVRNPSMVILPNGAFRLYYSGGTIWLDDTNFEEPKYIGYAESDTPLGVFRKHPDPILGPDETIPYRNFGAGAMKVYRYDGRFLGLENGMYRDADGRSRSAIDVLVSEDGLNWRDAPYNPIISPAGSGWKSALVYQLDLRWYDGKLWLYYNARDGWMDGVEWIGLSTMPWDGPVPEKMWTLPSGV